MGNSVFPTLPGLHWEFKVSDEYSVLVQKATAPGYETRVLMGPDPLLHFELTYDFLREPGAPDGYSGVDELQTLRGFFRARQGSFDSFLLDAAALTGNAVDGSVTGQVLTPDASGVAPLVVTGAGGYTESVYELKGTPTLSMAGVAMASPGDYTIQGPGVASPSGVTYPGLAAVITKAIAGAVTANLSWYYRVRFEQSTQEFDRFLALMYAAQQIKLAGTRT